jgi:hypothetical protein
MSKRKYTKEFLEPLVKEANSVRDLLRKINVTDSGGSHKLISKRIKEFEINTNHFKGGPRVPHNKLSSDDILVEDRTPYHKQLKRALIEIGRLYECGECSQESIWNNKELTLQIDHIDGNNRNQLKENLRFLCPNCHTQTKNWGFKNKIPHNKK